MPKLFAINKILRSSSHHSILIVTKERLLIDLWRSAWNSRDVRVSGCVSVEEAHEELQKQVYELVVVDLPLGQALELAGAKAGSGTSFVVLIEEGSEVPAALPSNVSIFPKDGPLGELLAGVRTHLGLPAEAGADGKTGKILVADDQEAVRIMLLRFLRDRGYSTVQAANGKEALDIIDSNPSIEIALLDLNMPQMGGMEVLAALMKRRVRPSVIVLSGVTDREIAHQALKLGAFDFIMKPFDPRAVESSISACFSHIQYLQQSWWKSLTRKYSLWATIVPLCLLLLAATAFGQDRYTDLTQISLEALMSIEVRSVSKKDQKLAETPAAVHVITQDDIRRSGATTVAEVLRLVPGVNVARIDANRWAVSIRGFSGAHANKLLMLIDGRSVYTSLFSGVYWDQQDLLLEDIDRIEVIRGPGATMWGANAVNGVINILTRDASKTQGGLLSSGAGSTERAFTSFRYGGKFGDNVSYRFYGKYSNHDSFKTLKGNDNGDDWDMKRGGFRMDWKPSRDAFMLQAGAAISDTGSQNRSLISIAPITYALQTDKTNSNTGYFLAQWSRISESREMSLKFYHDRSTREDESLGVREKATGIEWQNRFGLARRHDIVWGFGFRHTSDRTRNTLAIGFLPEKHSANLFNSFLQDEITLIQRRLRLTLGAKVEYNDDRNELRRTATGTQLEPNVRLMWTPAAKHSVWGAFSHAVRTPSPANMGLSVTYGAFTGANGVVTTQGIFGNPDVLPEVMRSYEFGYRVAPAKRVSVDIANFYATYNNLMDNESRPAFFEQRPVRHLVIPKIITNGLRGETYGSEVSVNLDVTRNWRLNSGYSLLRVRLHSLPGHMAPASDEGTAPQHQWLVRSSYDLAHGFQIDGALYYWGRLESFGTPSYYRADVRLGWRVGERLELSVTGQNLLKSNHPEFGTSGGATATQIPRNAYAKLTWRF